MFCRKVQQDAKGFSLGFGAYVILKILHYLIFSVYNHSMISDMATGSTQNTSTEARFARQAVQLQAILLGLLQPPSEHVFPELALSFREISLLHTLRGRPEMIMTDLATMLRLPLSTVTRMVDRLEKMKLVERARSEQDRRLVLVKTSDKAMLLFAEFEKMQLEVARRILEPLSHGEREILLELMMKLAPV